MLSCRPWREADRIYSILTRDLGLIRAQGLGVRKVESKLRGALEPITLSHISLVRGKEYWRATSAEMVQSIEPSLHIAKPLYLLEQLVQGEAAHPELFDAVCQICQTSDVGQNEKLELKLVSQILYHLGYLKESDLSLGKKELIQAINNGIEASHL